MTREELINETTAVLTYYRQNPPTTEQDKLAESMVKEYLQYLEAAE